MEIFENGVLGKPTPIMDAKLKVTGQLKYVADMKMSGMLYGKMLFSPYPHAEILSIDTAEAEKLDGVYGIVCYKDSPQVKYNGNGEDIDILPSEYVFDKVVRYVGDKVAAVAAETPAIAEIAVKLIKVEYRQLPYYLDPEDAAKADAYPIHETGNLLIDVDKSSGDIEKGFKEADVIFENHYTVPAIYHAMMEPHVSIADCDADGKITVYTPTQDVFGQRKNLSRIFKLPQSRVRVVSPAIGGAFGGKIDLITEPVAVLLSMKTGHPVKMLYNRTEDIQSTTTRHAEKIFIKTGVKKDGTITAVDYTVYLSAGAQSGGTMSVAWAAGGKFFKFLKTPNLHYHAIPVYTNRTNAGAMRGFGSPELFYALNSQMNSIANKLKMDLCEFELKNLHEPNTCDAHGEPLGNLQICECVKKGAELFNWNQALQEQNKSQAENGRFRIGVGMAASPHGSSMYGILPDTCGVMLKMNDDGSITMYTGVSEMGNGSNTLQKMLIAEVLGIPLDHIACVKSDSESTLYDVGSFASRGTYVGGNAAVKAAKMMRNAILLEGSELLNCTQNDLVLHNNCVSLKSDMAKYVGMDRIAEHAHEKERDIAVAAVYGSEAAPISGGAHFAKVQVDTANGEVQVIKYTAVHDVGKPLNPLGLECQVEGGIHMGLGYALSEGVILDKDGAVKGKRLRDCRLLHASQMPEIKLNFLDSYEETGPYGGKSVSECSVNPVAPAIINAINNALNSNFDHLPVSAKDIMDYVNNQERGDNR